VYLNGYFERTDIVPFEHLVSFLQNFDINPESKGNDSCAIFFIKSFSFDHPNQSIALNLLHAQRSSLRAIIGYAFENVSHNLEIVLVGYEDNEAAILVTECNIAVKKINGINQVRQVMNKSQSVVIPEHSSFWWLAMLSHNLRSIYIIPSPKRMSKCSGAEYHRLYGKNLLLSHVAQEGLKKNTQLCKLKP